MYRILVMSLVWLFFSGIIFAQQPPVPAQMKDMEKMQQEMQKRQQGESERLKKENPQLYQQVENQQKINSIVSSFHAGKISASQAESQLYPLIQQDIKTEMGGLESRIKNLEKKLEFLRRAKSNPDLLIKRRIDLMLGRIAPGAEDMIE